MEPREWLVVCVVETCYSKSRTSTLSPINAFSQVITSNFVTLVLILRSTAVRTTFFVILLLLIVKRFIHEPLAGIWRKTSSHVVTLVN